MKKQKNIIMLMLALFSFSAFAQNTRKVDVCIYGGSSAGIIAAYTAKKLGKSVIVIEPGQNIGGLTTGGLGATDIGNKYAISGLSKEFYRQIGAHYGKLEQWTFEPHVASKVYDNMIAEAKLEIVKNHRLIAVQKNDGYIKQITVEVSDNPAKNTNQKIEAKVFLDCTYEGDLMAKAGVSYATGREANSQYGEAYNGVQVSEYHQFPDGIDPYVIPGKPESGLLYGISDAKLKKTGSGDKLIQAYNFRICLTQDKNNQIAFTQPDNYKAEKYTLLARVIAKEAWDGITGTFKHVKIGDTTVVINKGGFLIKHMPNGKTDFNNFGPFSTDMVGANYDYPDGDYDTRKKIWKEHEDYTKGLFYFLANDKSVPLTIRKEMQSWGYAKDEFKSTNGFSNQLYVREARRMVGELVMTQKHCDAVETVTDGIAMAAYGMDSHTTQRILINGMLKNEGDVEIPVAGPFPISYRALTPKKSECKNLLVPICLSASHIAFGSIRMEPVFMVMGQSAATAAVMAIDAGVSVQDIDVTKLQNKLATNPLLNKEPLEIIVDNDNTDQLIIKGNWGKVKAGYGTSLLISQPSAEKKSVTFIPEIKKKGKYAVYVYISEDESKASNSFSFIISDGKTSTPVTITPADIKVLGTNNESNGEWVSLGIYKFKTGKKAFVEVIENSGKQPAIADAILFKPIK
ncbi:FAD-dependent oxidoreductase [Pedobacter arcticus]|uniref:FAD-dependent oxidoreductase n=1 Tax=Pedobacter arcticus TaxID=752140 RepID=UPI00036C4FB5|nr:FAD-dependent oxidoreductase [Pedobacter arcticus]